MVFTYSRSTASVALAVLTGLEKHLLTQTFPFGLIMLTSTPCELRFILNNNPVLLKNVYSPS